MSQVPNRLRKGASAIAVGALLSAPMILGTTTTAAGAEAHVDNPYAGATQYVNADWTAKVVAEAAAVQATNPTLAKQMLSIKDAPTGVWMDRIGAIGGNVDGPGLKHHLEAAVAQKQGSTPIVLNVVIYDLPGRDCYALASNGELPATDAGLARYKTEYIDPIANLLDNPEYAGIRIAATVEPDSLPNLTTNMSDPKCQQSAPYYKAGVAYALDKLHAIPNVYTYVDAAHSGWLGWENNATGAVQTFTEVAKSTKAGFASIDGFITNTANSTPLVEPFLTDSSASVGGAPVRSAKYYEWNVSFDEADWTADLHKRLVAAGFPATTGMLIDTSRNGWGGPGRPTAASTSTDLNTYVNASRIDRRVHRGAWCNPAGAGIGERPVATPSGYTASHLDAFVWIKPPGESDGSSSEIPNDEGKGFDRMCDPTFVSPKLDNQLTGALGGAPVSGKWFSAQFQQLVANAYPVIPADGTTDPTDPTDPPTDPTDPTDPPADTTAPTTPSGLAAGTTTTTSIPLTWTAATDNVAVTGYDVYQGTVKIATSTTTAYTVAALTPDTAYTFTVRAKDAAGNTSTPSTAVTARTQPTVTTPAGACQVTYTTNDWNSGFTGSVKIKNTSTTTLSAWTLGFTFPAGQQISQGWSAIFTQTATTVTATNQAWNGTLAAGATIDIGFNATHTGTNTPPTTFTLNGTTCS